MFKIDYAQRIEELLQHLEAVYGIKREHKHVVEALLCSLLPVSVCGAKRVRILLETDWYAYTTYDSEEAWFGFDHLWFLKTMHELRIPAPRRAIRALQEWLTLSRDAKPDATEPILYVEPEYHRPPVLHWNMKARGYEILSQVVIRARVKHPRSKTPAMDMQDRTDAQAILGMLARKCVDTKVRAPQAMHSIKAKPPQSLLYWCELAQTLADGGFRDWDTFTSNLVALAARRAALYGRMQANEEDWDFIGKLLKDCVPQWIVNVLTVVHEHRSPTVGSIMHHTGLTDLSARNVIKRLREQKVLSYRPTRIRFKDYWVLASGAAFEDESKRKAG